MEKELIEPKKIKALRILIRDDSPLFFADDSPSYRSADILLTPEQQIELLHIRTSGGNNYHECFSKAWVIDAPPITPNED